MRGRGAQACQGDQKTQVHGDHRLADRSQELRSPEGQAFLRHRQVRLNSRLTVSSRGSFAL